MIPRKIKILPAQIANKIAAGEVVDRPAAVVKELIENAIDAEASEITVIIEKSGKKLIQIIDNGIGIPSKQVELAFQRHATSKIESSSDLDRIATLGFRGEALPSIASVARVEVKSRSQEDEIGLFLRLEGGKITSQSRQAMNRGTVVSVKNLFFNTPARRNFMRADITEFNHINKILKRFFLSYPEIVFNVFHNNKEIYQLPKTDLESRLSMVLGEKLYEGLVYTEENLSGIQLHGYVCKPDMVRGNSENQFIFLNKRGIQNRNLNHAILRGYGNLIERSKYPQYVFFLDMPPHLVDINVHPTKMEVRFSNERAIYQLFVSAVRRAIQTDKIIPSFSMETRDQNRKEIEQQFRTFQSRTFQRQFVPQPKSPSDTLPENQLNFSYVEKRAKKGEFDDSANQYEQDTKEQQRLWQIHKRYICSQIKSGLVIIDQHVAHERILYEKFLNYLAEERPVPSQKLLFPQTLELALEDFLIYSEIKEWLSKIGFSITALSGRTVLIEAIPADVKIGYEGKILLEIVDYYRENQDVEYQPHEKIAAAFSCKNAIKSGEKMSQVEMSTLVDQLFATNEPYFCPHGRPVIVTLNLDEIDKKFKRQ